MELLKKTLFCFLTVLNFSWGAEQKDVQNIGPHYEIFRLEKSENPQNVLVIYTKLDKNCQFILEDQNSSQPVFGYYWLMDRKDYKPVHVLIRSGISDRLQVMLPPEFSKKRDFFSVQVKDLVQIDPFLDQALVRVESVSAGNSCQVKTTFNTDLGEVKSPSTSSHVMILNKIYAESEKTLLPPFRKVVSLRFEGTNEVTGAAEKKVFQGDGVK